MGDLLTLTNDLGRLVADATSLETSVGDPLRPAAPPAATVTLPTLTELADGRTFQASWVVRLHGIATSGAGFATLLDAAELLLAALVESSNPFRWAGATPALAAVAAGDAPAYVVTVTAELGAVIPVEGVPPQHGTATLTATATLIVTGQGGNARGVVTLTAVGTLSAGGHGATLTATATVTANATLSAGGHGATLTAGSTLTASGTLTVTGHGVAVGGPPAVGSGTLVARWDPSVSGSITASAGLVSQLSDLAGSHHLTQATGANQPTTGARTINGLNALDYPLPARQLLTTGTWTQAQPITLFIVVAHDQRTLAGSHGDSQVFGATAWNVNESPSDGQPHWMLMDTANVVRYPYSVALADANPHLLSIIVNAASSAVYQDGALSMSAAHNSAFTAGIASTVFAGGAFYDFDGALGEVLVYSGALNTTDRQAIEAYLRAKWGIA